MTDGTSQGLFIVVAIVIFGIFVVMAYILFEDTLSPAMASIFTTAIENVELDRNYVDLTNLRVAPYYHVEVASTKKELTLEMLEGTKLVAFAWKNKRLDDNSTYKITGKVLVNDIPVLRSQYFYKTITTQARSESFTVWEDGRFESIVKTDRSTFASHQNYFFHTKILHRDNSPLLTGDIVTVSDIRVEKMR